MRTDATARIGLWITVLGLVLAGAAAARLDATDVVVSGIVWYDDNLNGILDPDEERAPQVAVSILVGSYGPHGQQPHLALEVISGRDGRFQAAFEPLTGEPALALVTWALRPGYPYSTTPMIVPPPPDYVGFNYTSHMIPIPLDRGARVTVDIPLLPIRGMLARLAPGSPPDFAIPGGYFFTQTNGLVGGSAFGFSVTDTDGVSFWSTWRRLGLDNVGYPLSQRFTWGGFLIQVFQKAVFQWQPGQGVCLINVFDELHDRGLDRWLREHEATPLQLDPAFDSGKSWGQIVRDRLALLNASAALRSRYFSAPDHLLLYGLPTSSVQDLGDVIVLRTQRTVLQQWKADVPWARAGQVTLANGGEIATELDLFGNQEMFRPHLQPLDGSHRHPRRSAEGRLRQALR